MQRRIDQCEMNRGVSRLKWLVHANFDTRGELPSGVKNEEIHSTFLSQLSALPAVQIVDSIILPLLPSSEQQSGGF